jgi:hypothetical protein
MTAQWNFSILTTGDLQLALEDLFENRKKHTDKSAASTIYLGQLAPLLEKIQALPPVFRRRRPFAEELYQTDLLHDGLGAAIFFFTEAVARHPKLSAGLKRAVMSVRESFVPALSDLKATYADEAHTARKRRDELKTHRQALKSIPVPSDPPGKATMLDWVEDFITQGETLDDLLSDRATAQATANEATREQARDLRLKTIRKLNGYRSALADELEDHDASEGEDLDALIFGYFDELAGMRPGRSTTGGSEESPPKEEDEAPPPSDDERTRTP